MAKRKPTARNKPGTGPTNKQWRDALRLELARADGPTGTALERIARIVVHDALNGDYVAINEIANRIDGKVAVQENAGDAEPVQRLVVSWGGLAAAGRPEGGKVIEHSPPPPGPERSGASAPRKDSGPDTLVPVRDSEKEPVG